MADMFNIRSLMAVVGAGVIGTLANAVAIAIFVSLDRMALVLVPGRYGVAIALCLMLPILARYLNRAWFFVVGTVWLTVAASVLAKFVFAAAAPWLMVLGLNLVYAIAAIIVYHLISAQAGR